MTTALASSAIENFDLIQTISEAISRDIKSVQLFIDSSKFNDDYIESLIRELKGSALEIIIHLRNHPKFNDPAKSFNEHDKAQVERLINALPELSFKVLIHYQDGMTIDDVPIINGSMVGIENSKTGSFDPGHVQRAYDLARQCEENGSFFVFDHGRIMYASSEQEAQQIIKFVTGLIKNNLIPGKDIIHSADKTDWSKKFRDCWTYLGDESGVGFALVAILRNYSIAGGTIVFEHENLQLAVKSAQTIEG